MAKFCCQASTRSILQNKSLEKTPPKKTLIDLIFTDEAVQVFDIAHHNVRTFKFNCYLDYLKIKDKYADTKADFEAMKTDFVNTNWQDQLIASGNDKNIEDIWNILKSKVLDLRDKFVSGKPFWKKMGNFPINKPRHDAIRYHHSTHWLSLDVNKKL